MRLGSILILGALVFGCIACPSLAVDSSENAALQYYRAWLIVDMDALEELLEPIDWETIGDPDWHPPEGVTLEKLEEFQPELFVDAAALHDADWGIDWDMTDPTDLNQPHLGQLRLTSRYLSVVSRLQLENKDSAQSIRYLIAALQTGEHAADGHSLISSLVSASAFETASRVLSYAQTVQQFAADQMRADLQWEFHLARMFDPFRCAEALEWESTAFDRAVRTGIAEGQVELLAERLLPAGHDANDQILLASLRELLIDPEALDRELQAKRALDEQIVHFWVESPKLSELSRLDREIAHGEHGALARIWTPALGKTRLFIIANEKRMLELVNQFNDPDDSSTLEQAEED